MLFTTFASVFVGHGEGETEDQLKPKLVEALRGFKVIDVACGSGDAQTLCITDNDCVWSWGDGDFGKLGRGGSDGCKIPMPIDDLIGVGIIRVECGSQFSLALSNTGLVYTWLVANVYFYYNFAGECIIHCFAGNIHQKHNLAC